MFLLKKLIRLLLSSNDDKIMQSIDLVETYAYRTREDLVSEKIKLIDQIKSNNIIKGYKE